jgi:hypothetical protein
MDKKQFALSFLIKDFIAENSRTPSPNEINYMYNEYLRNHPDYLESGYVASKPQEFKQKVSDEASAQVFNKTVFEYVKEQENIIEEIEVLEEEAEDQFRMFSSKFDETLLFLKKIERNINKNLLLHSKDDIYTHGIVESFQDYDKIDFKSSNIYMFNGKVTLGYTKVAGENFDSKNLSYRVVSREGRPISQRNINNISSAINEDGNFFKVLVFSKIPDDSIDFYVDLNFDEAKEIDTLKFTTQAIESNSKLSYSCYYSQDSSKFHEVFESNLRVNSNENFVEVNKANVKNIRLVLNKNGYDYIDGDNYVYIYTLDFIGGTTKKFKINEESVLNLGPYQILDEDNEPINFSMATIKGGTCCVVPERTSIDFYLSKDRVNWIKTDYNNTSKQVVQFEESEEKFDGSGVFKRYQIANSSNPLSFIIEDVSKIKKNLLNQQKLLNFYVLKEDFKNIVKESMSIKRNVCKKENRDTYGAKEGWYLDETKYYNCFINIKEAEGRYLDFGERSCFLDGKQVSGKIFLNYGEHTFKTSEENWFDLDEPNETIFQNEMQLREEDILYPYNHKYIVEGFNYSASFSGRKRYLSRNEIYSHKLKEVSNQRFLLDKSLNTFTFLESSFENEAGDIVEAVFIMVNSSEESSESKIEDYILNCKKRNVSEDSVSNELYIKAVLRSSDPSVTPKIDQIQVRVI